MNTRIRRLVAGILLGLAAAAAVADSSHDNAVFAGAYILHFDTQTPGLTGPYTVPGLGAGLKDTATLYLAYIRRLNEHFDFELAAGAPPVTRTIGRGPATLGSVPYDGQTLITARWLSPTALIEYKFFSEDTPWRPYLGVGINHTAFYDRNVTGPGQAVTGGPTSVSLSASTGIAATAGISYRFQERWFAHASYSVSNIHTNAVADTAGIERTAHIAFGPRAVVLAVGYTF